MSTRLWYYRDRIHSKRFVVCEVMKIKSWKNPIKLLGDFYFIEILFYFSTKTFNCELINLFCFFFKLIKACKLWQKGKLTFH